MYQREAAHFSAKKMFGAASHKLALGESLSPSCSCQSEVTVVSAAHALSPDDTHILASLAHSLVRCGHHQQALHCAERVLCQVIPTLATSPCNSSLNSGSKLRQSFDC